MSGLYVLLIVPWAIAGGWSYRTRGGGNWPADLPRIVDLGIWGLLLALPLWFIAPWWAALIGVAWVMALTSWGHGDFLDMGGGTGDPDEVLAKLVTLLTGRSDGFWRDALGMGISGATYVVGPAVIATVFAGPLWLLWLGIGFLGKGAAYVLGKRFAAPGVGLGHTVIGEYLTGFTLCGGAGLLWFVISLPFQVQS